MNKINKIKVDGYRFLYEGYEFIYSGVTVVVPPRITNDTFDQFKHEHVLPMSELQRLEKLSRKRIKKNNAKRIVLDKDSKYIS